MVGHDAEHKSNADYAAAERLLRALAENLKLPFLQIARRAELARLTNEPLEFLDSIELTADAALQLLDNYLLSLRLSQQPAVHLEPISVAAILHDTAHKLEKLAKLYDCDVELNISGKYEPIMAHKAGLSAALVSLGYVFIEAQSIRAREHRPVIKLAAHRGKKGIVAGMFADMDGLSTDMYRRARELYGRAPQPLSQFTSASGAGVFVADSLLNSMSANLRIAHHQKLTGLAATFIPSRQMSLV